MENKKTLYQRLAEIKEELSKANLKKTGINKYSGFTYYELADILPAIISLCKKYGVYTYTTYDNELAKLVAVNTEDSNDKLEITSPMRTFELKGSNAIQVLGGIETYSRRYLYIAMFDIVESDSFDANCGSDKNVEVKPQNKVVDIPTKAENKEGGITLEQKTKLINLQYKGKKPLGEMTYKEADMLIKIGVAKSKEKEKQNENNI